MEWIWILGLVIIGAALLLSEIFMPGMILGILGGVCLVGSVVLSFKFYGAGVGSAVLVGEILVLSVSLFVVMDRLPKTAVGKSVMLHETNTDRGIEEELKKFVGQTGKATNLCRPLGVALILGQRIDVQAENGYIESDTPVIVTRVEGRQVWVKEHKI